jgi:hypothetical protein
MDPSRRGARPGTSPFPLANASYDKVFARNPAITQKSATPKIKNSTGGAIAQGKAWAMDSQAELGGSIMSPVSVTRAPGRGLAPLRQSRSHGSQVLCSFLQGAAANACSPAALSSNTWTSTTPAHHTTETTTHRRNAPSLQFMPVISAPAKERVIRYCFRFAAQRNHRS